MIGVLFADSPLDLRFSYDEEDALVAVAGQLGTAIHFLQQTAESAEPDGNWAPAYAGATSGCRSASRSARRASASRRPAVGSSALR